MEFVTSCMSCRCVRVAAARPATRTKLRVLLAIADVGGVPEVAAAFGVSDSTVKTHLGRLFEKNRRNAASRYGQACRGVLEPACRLAMATPSAVAAMLTASRLRGPPRGAFRQLPRAETEHRHGASRGQFPACGAGSDASCALRPRAKHRAISGTLAMREIERDMLQYLYRLQPRS